SWTLMHRSAQYCQAAKDADTRFAGAGQVMMPHHYLLLTGPDYAGPAGDLPMKGATAVSSIADTASLELRHGTQLVDALCYSYNADNLKRLLGTGDCSFGAYVCEGTPVSNLPHDGTQGSGGSVDQALERKPGGALGNMQDTGDSAADFVMVN